ncbi:hypothetical protein [Pseudomonas sp. Marseille-QA0892]
MKHQRHRLALFLDAVPSHQVCQALPGTGQGTHPQLFFTAGLASVSAIGGSLLLGFSHTHLDLLE